ncbi:MAG: zinc-dependent metalloprotease [Actinobacteria bacterium]|nr:zinc-dependent metalloprotease [Actinomycetota bacterium]
MTTRIRAAVVLLTMLMLAALAPMGGAGAETPAAPSLFTPAAQGRADLPPQAHVARQRLAAADLDVLFADGAPRGRASLPAVSLDLFPDASYTGLVTDVTTDQLNGGVSWAGTLDGVGAGYFYLAVADGAMALHVASPEGVFEASPAGGGLYRIVEVDQSAFTDHPPEADAADGTAGVDSLADTAGTADLPGPTTREAAADGGVEVIDVLVVYTADARQGPDGYGTTASMKALLLLAMTETNHAYDKAGAQVQLRLVHTEEVPYVETGDLFLDLPNLYTGATGLKKVSKLRNTYGADMVALIVLDGGAYCGLAAGILPSADYAYQVTARDCATGYYSFGHEFGHLQGARHDQYVDPYTTPYQYGHGWVNTDDRWRTIMAYNDLCADTDPYDYCQRLDWWSNPNLNVEVETGAPAGGVDAENYRVLTETAPLVAAHRSTRIGEDFLTDFTADAPGWKKLIGYWKIDARGYYWTKGKLDIGALTMYNLGGFGDVTYEVRMRRVGCDTCANRIVIRGNHKKRVGILWEKSYVFQYTKDGRFSVFRVDPGGTTEWLAEWTSHPAIASKWNDLKVVAVGDDLAFSINDVLVWQGTDPSFSTGTLGIAFYRNSSTLKNKVYVDWAAATTTATAEAVGPVVPGTPVGGGTIDEAP